MYSGKAGVTTVAACWRCQSFYIILLIHCIPPCPLSQNSTTNQKGYVTVAKLSELSQTIMSFYGPYPRTLRTGCENPRTLALVGVRGFWIDQCLRSPIPPKGDCMNKNTEATA